MCIIIINNFTDDMIKMTNNLIKCYKWLSNPLRDVAASIDFNYGVGM